MTRKKYLNLFLLPVSLILIFSAFFPVMDSRSPGLIIIYLILYFLTFYFFKKSSLWNSSRLIMGILLFIYLPCVWTDGSHLGMAQNLFVLKDLFSSNNFFIHHGPNLIESIKKKDVNVIFQMYSIILGTGVYIKLVKSELVNKVMLRNIWTGIRRNFWVISGIITIYGMLDFYYISPLLEMKESFDFKYYRFNLVILYLSSYFLLLLIYKSFILKKTLLKTSLNIIFILLFPVITLSTTPSIQYTDSMEYDGLFPILSPFGSSFFQVFYGLFQDSYLDPLNINIQVLIYGLVQIIFIFIIMRPVLPENLVENKGNSKG